jgi:hypothetical protein
MILALASFVWFYWNMHKAPRLQQIQVVPASGGDR